MDLGMPNGMDMGDGSPAANTTDFNNGINPLFLSSNKAGPTDDDDDDDATVSPPGSQR